MKIYKTLTFLALLNFSCNNIMDRIFHPYNEPEDFMFYEKDYKLSESEDLKTNKFYFTQGVGVSGEYYLYLKFFSDGGVYYSGGTSLAPDSIEHFNFLNVERKRNGIPKDRKASWGYYQCRENKLMMTILDQRALSSVNLKYHGIVKEDTLFMKIYEKGVNDSTFQLLRKEKYYYFNR